VFKKCGRHLTIIYTKEASALKQATLKVTLLQGYGPMFLPGSNYTVNSIRWSFQLFKNEASRQPA
jgi:hypothetical protein